jgi:hypothetical protein
VGQIDRVQRDPEGLEHGCVRRGEGAWKRDHAVLRPGYPFAQAAVLDPVARKSDTLAEIGVAVAARGASVAGNRGIDRHAAPVFGDTAELVTENEGPDDGPLADAALGVPMEIRAAESDCPHAHQDLAGTWSRAFLVVKAKVASSVKARDAHTCRD